MPKILVVDDDEVDRELTQRSLSGLDGVEVVYAGDGREALDRLAAELPDLILTDLRMPRMDGLELVESVKADYPALPVVLMTAQGSEQVAVKALQSGAASYVPKSAMKSDLVDVVEHVLEAAEARKSARSVLAYMGETQTRFDLENDPALVSPLGAWCEENLERLGFANGTVRSQVGIALVEAVSNAIIHGNLEVSSELRRSDREAYYKRIDERRRQKPYADRRVRFTARETPGAVEYVVCDEGPGFDRRALPDPTSAEGVLQVSGRGVWLITRFMDRVAYNERGNEVVMSKTAV